MKNIKNNKGITLIALVITIIIMLILAGVGVVTLTGENGLLKRASGAGDVATQSHEKELIQAEVRSSYSRKGDLDIGIVNTNIKSNINGVTTNNAVDFPLLVSFTATKNAYLIDKDGNVTLGYAMATGVPTTPVDRNTIYSDGTNIAVIPKGFKVSSNSAEQTIDTGLVVLDGNDNEWVWIPVPNASVMYTKVNDGITITGGEGNTFVNGVTTKYYSKTILNDFTRGLPNVILSNCREPDIVVGTDGTIYDNAMSQVDSTKMNYEIAGFSSLKDMAKGLVDDYEEMIKSVEKNKGFYVGRYELTGSISSPTEIEGESLANQDWYSLYKACKTFSVNKVVESRMIWGCQWDVMCNFISDTNHNITDSTTWGNYKQTDVKSSNGSTVIKPSGNSTRLKTGQTTFTMAKNIYDIAGNCYEYSQEADSHAYRCRRGGSYSHDGSAAPAYFRIRDVPASYYNNVSTRPTLYIK